MRYCSVEPWRLVDQFVPALMREGLSRCPAFPRTGCAEHVNVAIVVRIGEVDRVSNRGRVRAAHGVRLVHAGRPKQLGIGSAGGSERMRSQIVTAQQRRLEWLIERQRAA